MFAANRSLFLLKLPKFVKYSTLNRSEKLQFELKTNFTEDEQKKILNTLNKSNTEQLLKFSVSECRIKNLEDWKNEKGPFRTLNDVLEVNGLDEEMEKLCQQIITMEPVKKKKNKQIVTPRIPEILLDNITSAVGVNLSPTGVSWAKIIKQNNNINDWNYQKCALLPNKAQLNEIFDLAISVIRKMPAADVYIFQANPTSKGQSQAASNTQKCELSSMLFALLNTSQKHNLGSLNKTTTEKPQKILENRVFHIKSYIPAMLFKTRVGNETVSGIQAVADLINKSPNCSLPCTPISIEKELCDTYNSQSTVDKELLSQALMLVVSFMDLCVYKNLTSISAITSNRKKNL